jgi:hypothetical protein
MYPANQPVVYWPTALKPNYNKIGLEAGRRHGVDRVKKGLIVTNMHKAYAGLLVVVGIAALARILSVGIGSKAPSGPEAGNFKVSTVSTAWS